MANKQANDGLFRRLTQLFRSGPIVKRKIKAFKEPTTSTVQQVFKKNMSHVYSNAMSAYGSYDRLARYSDFSEMEYTPEISSALDIYSEEAIASDDKDRVLHIYSENRQIQKLLEDLFYDTLNVEFNLTPWVRDMVKYGDFFLFNDVSTDHGILNVIPMPVNEVEREERFDPKDPLAVRYRWTTQGNQILENWQVTHFRLLGNDAFLPYGSSILEPARRIWRQLILIEDAMLVYRVVRSPERRVFYIDVGNIAPEDVPNYMEQAKTVLRSNQVIDANTGRVDLRYNPLSVDEDYFLPVRGGETGSKIDTLAGGTNVTAIEDVEYIQKKLFAALKVPKAYLGYDESIGSKATLSQEDIRFSRTIARIQRVVVSELNKLAIIHLYSHGFEGEDLLDFTLALSNPSTIAQQQKLEIYRTKFEIAGSVPEGLVDRLWLRKNIMHLTDDEIDRIDKGRINDKQVDTKVEAAGSGEAPKEGGAGGGGGGGSLLGASEEPPEGEEDAGPEADAAAAGGAPESPDAGAPPAAEEEKIPGEDVSDEDLFASVNRDHLPIIASGRSKMYSINDENAPMKMQNEMQKQLDKVLYNRSRKSRDKEHGITNFEEMVNDSATDDPYDEDSVNQIDPFKESRRNIRDVLDEDDFAITGATAEWRSTLKSLKRHISTSRSSSIISEVSEDDTVTPGKK